MAGHSVEFREERGTFFDGAASRIFIDLKRKVVMITQKHRDKVLSFFDSFLASARAKGRISVKRIQRMLGLQIWSSTVFRVARQFLTSVCDILKISARFSFFYPRRHPALVARSIQDLGFWRRFVCSSTEAEFQLSFKSLTHQ